MVEAAGPSCFIEKLETRTDLSTQIFEKCCNLSDELWQLNVNATLPQEGGAKLLIFPKGKNEIDLITVASLLLPLTPVLIIATDDPIEYLL